jgi:hypothetical protein
VTWELLCVQAQPHQGMPPPRGRDGRGPVQQQYAQPMRGYPNIYPMPQYPYMQQGMQPGYVVVARLSTPS